MMDGLIGVSHPTFVGMNVGRRLCLGFLSMRNLFLWLGFIGWGIFFSLNERGFLIVYRFINTHRPNRLHSIDILETKKILYHG